LAKILKFNLDSPQDFLDAYHGCNIEERDILCEFYFYNCILPHPYDWNPNPYVGNIQLMDFVSWLRNEEMRAEELKNYMKEEQQTPLWNRAKAIRPKYVISNHHNRSCR